MGDNNERARHGRRRLFGSLDKLGVEFEWHDYQLLSGSDVSWIEPSKGSSIEVCLNLSGEGNLCGVDKEERRYGPQSIGFHCRAEGGIYGKRRAGQRHRFFIIRFSQGYVGAVVQGSGSTLHPLIHDAVTARRAPAVEGVGPIQSLDTRQLQMVRELSRPPVLASAQRLWYQSKAWEWIVECFFVPSRKEEPLCLRQRRVARERVDKVIEILCRHLEETPRLEELGRQVGCSPYYLSRTFSKEMGLTIPQYLRKLRMEEAAQLLRSGRHNVTEAALAVGYSSISHFSNAFCQMMGCCPTLYPHLQQPQAGDQFPQVSDNNLSPYGAH